MSKPKKTVSVSFAGDDDVLQHIVNIHERRKSLRSIAKTPVTADIEESSDNDLEEEEEVFKPSAALSTTEVMAGSEVYGFKTPRKSKQFTQRASESAPVTPKTPKAGSAPQTPKSILKKTPGSRRGSTVTIVETPKRGKNKGTKDVRKPEARTPHRLRARNKPVQEELSSDESISSESDNDSGDENNENITPPKTPRTPGGRKRKLREEDEGITTATVESYFALHSGSAVTSDRTLSRLENPRMDQEALSEALSGVKDTYTKERLALYKEHEACFNKWMYMMCNGFNILLHGVGSKGKLMEHFRCQKLKDFNNVVINGYFPSITIKSILNAITEDILDHNGSFRSPLEQVSFIRKQYECGDYEDLYLVIHNIDGVMLRAEKVQSVLSMLAQVRGLHIIASIDHINAPLVWDQNKLSQFKWLWHDATTFEPYKEETSYENSLLVQQSGVLALSSLVHVMKSLTPNAKNIYLLLVNYQLDNKDDKTFQGLSFPDLYQKCRENFLVNSDVTLRQQLTEFRDHKLVKSKIGLDGVEYLIIPLDEATLKEFIQQHEDTG